MLQIKILYKIYQTDARISNKEYNLLWPIVTGNKNYRDLSIINKKNMRYQYQIQDKRKEIEIGIIRKVVGILGKEIHWI